jgi:hypothetical protein
VAYFQTANVDSLVSSGNVTGGNILTAGLISVTGNVSGNFFIGNGSQLTGITASANTGNVTFNDQAVVGTGNPEGGGGLYLAPGTESVGNLQYIRVRGGDVVTHIHLDTGNNAYFDQYFGDDSKYVKLEAGATGNIIIGTNANNWNFDASGNLTLPGNIIAINYANGNRVTGGITFNGEAVIGTGTSNTQSGLYLAPDPVSLVNDLYLRVRGNIIDEPTHIHFDTGNNQYFNQFIGDDNKYIQLANTGNIVVNTNDNAGNSAQWTFGTGGTTQFPNSVILAPVSESITMQSDQYSQLMWENANLTVAPNMAINSNFYVSQNNATLDIAKRDGSGTQVTKSWYWNADGTLTLPTAGRINFDYLSISSDANVSAFYAPAGNVQLAAGIGDAQIVANSLNDSKTWTFGNTGNLTAPGNVSAVGNVTGAYILGNGSQLTGITASVPSQTILPTIQTITVEARPAGLFGGGQGGANVTVANTIPVTEYGVIITDGTTSEKYKTGSLGSIPGTVSLTFTTGLNSAQFTVFAYVTSNAGTFYSNSATGTSGICLLAGTQIALSNGTHKAIEHITYTDKMLSWDFDRGCYAETTAMWIKRSETGSQYNLLTFSDGTTLRTFDQHRIFNKQAGAFTYPMTDATPVGTITVNEHGQEITLINKQVIVDTIEYYNVITDHHMNLFSNSILTSCRFNNIYPIQDMKFVKDSRPLRSRSEFHQIDDRFFHGLRLAEQQFDLAMIEWYVSRLESLEINTDLAVAV